MTRLLPTGLTILAASLFAAGARPHIRVVREGAVLGATRPERIISLLVALVAGSSVRPSASVEVAGAWMDRLRAPSFIHLRLRAARDMRVKVADNQEWRSIPVREILLVVPANAWPGEVLLKTSSGVTAVTKYPPCTLVELLSESQLAELDRDKTRFAAELLLASCGRQAER